MRKLMKLAFAFIIILSFGIMIQSCKLSKQAPKTNYPTENTPNISGTWILKTLNSQSTTDIFKEKIPTMTLDPAENRIFGNSGCNNYTGTYTYTKGILSAPDLASTKMMCPDENQETQFLATLGMDNKISLANNTILTLKNNGKTVAEFIKGIDTSLLQGEWILESIADGDVKILFSDKIPTIKFDKQESRLSGDAGCNSYGATYKIEGTTITVGPIVATRMACPHMEGESKFTQIITGESTLEASTEKITFTKEGKIILTFVKATK